MPAQHCIRHAPQPYIFYALREWLALVLIFAGLFYSATMHASTPLKTAALKDTGVYSARFVRDQGNIAIIELSGNYDRDLPDGTFNQEPRAVIAREFYRSHPDAYDMLVVFTGFPVVTGEAFAFHHRVSNQVHGIGIPPLDSTAAYGSKGKLLGMIDMADLARHKTDSMNKGFDFSLQTFAHEFLHQFAAYVKYRKPDGSIASDLLGRDGAHWSYLLDTSASVLYGSKWRDNGDGTFTATATMDNYSPLDLYLMGLLKKEEVPPFFLIDAPGIDPTQIPLLGATVRGTRRMVTIDDIIAVEGPRFPDASQSQKDFRLTFIYAVRPGQAVTEVEITAMNNIRQAIATRFSVLTGGVGNINLFTEPISTLTPGAPPGLPPPASPPATNINLQQGLAWLKLKQLADGSWADTPPTAIRDSAVSAQVLQDLEPTFSGLLRASQWMDIASASSNDFAARKISAMVLANRLPADTRVADLIANQNSDGGWGVAKGYTSNPLDTALAVQALLRRTNPVDDIVNRALTYLRGNQNADGGWGSVSGGVSRTSTSAQVSSVLQTDTGSQATVNKAKLFLATRQNSDGGFGDSPSSIHDTANVLSSLMSMNATGGIRMSDALQYLSVNQRVNGSWSESVYSTALALNVLARANAMNWAVTGFSANPARTMDGGRVTLNVIVKNTGNRNAPTGKLRIYAGDPASGTASIGPDVDIPILVPGATATVAMQWNTLGKAGATTLFAVIDPDRTQQELSIADNTATLAYTVDIAQTGVDLLVTPADILVTPANPTQIPASLTISALLTNAGLADTANVKVTLWQGTGSGRQRIADALVATFPGRSTRTVTFTATLTSPGATAYAIEIDPDNAVNESDKSNNAAQFTVSTEAGIDLEVLAADITLDKLAPRNGDDVLFSVKLRNRGTVDTPDFAVRYTIETASGLNEILSNTLHLKAGEQVSQSVPYRTSQTGSFKFGVELDAKHVVAENDKTNNTAQLAFAVTSDSGPSLAVNYKDITLDPAPALEGSPLIISALIRNLGNQTASQVEVAIYSGDPALGGTQIGALQVIPEILAGGVQSAALTWDKVPDAKSKLIFVVVDPANKIPADINRDDNRAFVTLPVLSLPDLALTTGNLKLTPTLPKPGENVTLEVRVDNLGQQAASNILARVFDGDPLAGGVQVGGDRTIAAIAPKASATTVFSWSFPATAGDRVLYVQIDPLQTVNETNRANNTAQLVVGVQSGDFTLSTRYISPNGDGILDTVDFSFRLQTPNTVTAQVLNTNGTVVRRYSGPEFTNAAAGRWTWDGRNDTGSIVRDDDYRIQLVDGVGQLIGEAIVTLDNNRSSLLDALGTPWERISNLSCAIPQSNDFSTPRLTEDGSRAYFILSWPTYTNPNQLPQGVYRVDGYGGGFQQVIPGSQWYSVLASPDGSRLALTSNQSLWVSNGDGGELRQIDLSAIGAPLQDVSTLAFTASGTEIIATAVVGANLHFEAVPVNGAGLPRILFTTSSFPSQPQYLLSPDKQKLLVSAFDSQSQTSRYTFVDVASGIRTEANLGTPDRFYWAPDSRTIAVLNLDQKKIDIFDVAGTLVRAIVLTTPGEFKGIDWGDDSSEFFATTQAPNWCATKPECAVDAVIQRFAVASGESSEVFRVSGQVGNGEGGYSGVALLPRYIPGAGQILVNVLTFDNQLVSVFSWNTISTEAPYTTKTLSANFESLLHEMVWSTKGYLHNLYNAYQSYAGFRDFGRSFFYLNWQPPESSCQLHSSDYRVLRSLANLTAELGIVRTASSLKFKGSASDAHFAQYTLDYAHVETPATWVPIAPVFTTQVVDSDLGQWAPPGPGAYLVRLTVEDLAGNRRTVTQRVQWGANTVITDLFRSPEYISPNGDGIQDQALLHYRVLEPVNLEFNIYDSLGSRVRTFTRNHPAALVDVVVEWDGRGDSGAVVADGTYRLTVLDYEFAIKVDSTYPQQDLNFVIPLYDKTVFPGIIRNNVVPPARFATETETRISKIRKLPSACRLS